jgi:hypothetical protein
MRALRLLLVGATVAGSSGCSDVFGPWGSEGFYDLRSANGDRVPAVVFERYGNDPLVVTMLGGELHLRRDDSFRLDIDYVEHENGTEFRYTQGVSGYWEWDGDAIWLDYIDPQTGEWESLAANRHHDALEIVIPGVLRGTSIRTVFRR